VSGNYTLKARLRDGREMTSEFIPSGRRYHVGDFINIPVGRDGKSRPGYGYVWRVVNEESPDVLVLEYVRKYVPPKA
jgi:hypothetical protein